MSFETIRVGEQIPSFTTAPISRQTLALFAGASGDHNPIHVDIDYAKSAGLDDVFAHGMLPMAYLGRLLTNWVPPTALRQFGVRFAAITHVHDQITCAGKVVEKIERDGERQVRLELTAVSQDGDVKLIGEAVVALP